MRVSPIVPVVAVAGLLALAAAWGPLTDGSQPGARTPPVDAASRARTRAETLDRQARTAALASERAAWQAAAIARDIQQAERALARANRRQRALASEQRALAAQLAKDRAPLAQIAAGLVTAARRPPALAVLQPGSLRDSVHLRAVASAIAPQIEARTSGVKRRIARQAALSAEVARHAAITTRAQARLVQRRADLETLATTERLKAQRAAGSAYRAAEGAMAVAARARDPGELVRGPEGQGARRARLAAPGTAVLRPPVAGPILSSPGPGEAFAGLRYAPRPGAPVVAPAAGRVAFAGPYRGFGAIVIIDHGGGLVTLLTGLTDLKVAVGQMVLAASPLGAAPAREPFITLEVRRNGIPVDPRSYLPAS